MVRELHLADGFVSAGSGLARARGRLYVAADDDLALAVFAPHGAEPGARLALSGDELPSGRAARKAAKPDLEAVVALPSAGLLVLGSGATDRRHRGFVASLDGEDVRELDLSHLHAAIAREVDGPLNLEGAEWHAGALVLAQRGTAGTPNALIRVSWPGLELLAVNHLAAPSLAGRPLGMTDLARLPDGRLLAAYTAEDTDDPYVDGAVAGSAVGVVGEEPLALDRAYKVEGLWSDGRELLMVTDADDPAQPAVLLRAVLPTA